MSALSVTVDRKCCDGEDVWAETPNYLSGKKYPTVVVEFL